MSKKVFWDKISPIYDLFETIYNRKVFTGTGAKVAEMIEPSDRKTTKKALLNYKKCLFYEGGRWDLNPRSSGTRSDADGFSAVSHDLIESCFAPVFRGQKLI